MTGLYIRVPVTKIEQLAGEQEDNEKSIREMTNKEILRRQLELLAESSKTCSSGELPELTKAMVQIYSILELMDIIK